MAIDVNKTVRDGHRRAQNMGSERSRPPLKLFPGSGLFQLVAMNTLEALPRTRSGNRLNLVMTYRYKKISRAVPTSEMTALHIFPSFLDNWVGSYGASRIRSDGNQSIVQHQVFRDAIRFPGKRHLSVTSYHAQTNGKADIFPKKMIPRLQHYRDAIRKAETYTCSRWRTNIIPRCKDFRICLHLDSDLLRHF